MKKTTYIIIAILALLLVMETLSILALMRTGRSRSDITAEPESHSPYRRIDKIEVNVGNIYQSVSIMSNRVDSLSLSPDSIYQPDTLIVIGKDINLFIYN